MTDTQTQTLHRAAKAGDPESAYRWCVATIRASGGECVTRCERCQGTNEVDHENGFSPCYASEGGCKGTGRTYLTHEQRIELAAYAGHEIARVAVGFNDYCKCGFPLPRAKRVGSYSESCHENCVPGEILLGLRWLTRYPGAPLRAAIAAAETVLAVPFVLPLRAARKARTAINAAQTYADDPTEENREAWNNIDELVPDEGTYWVPSAYRPGGPGEALVRPEEIRAAARRTSETGVREAIQANLQAWALGSSPP